MSWQTESTELLRVTINDMDVSPTYSDERLERVLVIAALQVLNSLTFDTAYKVDIPLATITPDPTDQDPKDAKFINLVALRAAKIVISGELKQYSISGGMSISDGPSKIDMSGAFKNLMVLQKKVDADYEEARKDYSIYVSQTNFKAITTPSTVEGLSIWQT